MQNRLQPEIANNVPEKSKPIGGGRRRTSCFFPVGFRVLESLGEADWVTREVFQKAPGFRNPWTAWALDTYISNAPEP